MTAPGDTSGKVFIEHMQRVETNIATIKGDVADVKAEIMLLRVIIENAARFMADAMHEPQTDRIA